MANHFTCLWPAAYTIDTGRNDYIEFSFIHRDGGRGTYHINFEVLPLNKKDFNTLFQGKISREAAGELADYITSYCDWVNMIRNLPGSQKDEKYLVKCDRELKKYIVMSECLHSYFNDIPIYGSKNSETENHEKITEVTIMKKSNYFKGIKTLEELRNTYRDLLKKHHPDNGGSVEIMQEVNAQYKATFEALKMDADLTDEKESIKWNAAEDEAIREALYKIIHLQNINIEIVGSWIWVDGETFTRRDILNSAGYKWSRNRKKWHFAPYEKTFYKHGKKYTFDDIRAKYGSEKVETEKREELTA